MNFVDNKLYACGPEGGEVAGRVRYDETTKLITWFNPGGRQRAYEVEQVVVSSPEQFVFFDERGRRFELRELTPAAYNARIKREQDPPLNTTEELLEAFQRSQ